MMAVSLKMTIFNHFQSFSIIFMWVRETHAGPSRPRGCVCAWASLSWSGYPLQNSSLFSRNPSFVSRNPSFSAWNHRCLGAYHRLSTEKWWISTEKWWISTAWILDFYRLCACSPSRGSRYPSGHSPSRARRTAVNQPFCNRRIAILDRRISILKRKTHLVVDFGVPAALLLWSNHDFLSVEIMIWIGN